MKEELIFFGQVLLIIAIATIAATFHDIIKWLSGYKMKIETKRKLIRLFHKLIKYDITKDTERTIQIKTIDILRLRWDHIYENDELDWLERKEVLTRICATHLIDKASQDGIIKISKDLAFGASNKTRVSAELYILLKK